MPTLYLGERGHFDFGRRHHPALTYDASRYDTGIDSSYHLFRT